MITILKPGQEWDRWADCDGEGWVRGGEESEKGIPVLMSLLPCKQWWIQDFPEGCQHPRGGVGYSKLLFCNMFAANCMKMKEFLLTTYN